MQETALIGKSIRNTYIWVSTWFQDISLLPLMLLLPQPKPGIALPTVVISTPPFLSPTLCPFLNSFYPVFTCFFRARVCIYFAYRPADGLLRNFITKYSFPFSVWSSPLSYSFCFWPVFLLLPRSSPHSAGLNITRDRLTR